jgi:hypothetical protein
MTITWIAVFVYSWILFFLFVDEKRLNKTIYGGIIALALGSMVDWAGNRLDLYHFNADSLGWLANSVLYSAGPLFTMGTLFFQYLSRDRRTQAVNIMAFTAAYFAVELLIVGVGAASYRHWHYLASLTVDILVFTTFSYVGEIIVFGGNNLLNKR